MAFNLTGIIQELWDITLSWSFIFSLVGMPIILLIFLIVYNYFILGLHFTSAIDRAQQAIYLHLTEYFEQLDNEQISNTESDLSESELGEIENDQSYEAFAGSSLESFNANIQGNLDPPEENSWVQNINNCGDDEVYEDCIDNFSFDPSLKWKLNPQEEE